MTTEPSDVHYDLWPASIKMIGASVVGAAVLMAAVITAISLTPRHCGGPDGNTCPVTQKIHPDAGSAPNKK